MQDRVWCGVDKYGRLADTKRTDFQSAVNM